MRSKCVAKKTPVSLLSAAIATALFAMPGMALAQQASSADQDTTDPKDLDKVIVVGGSYRASLEKALEAKRDSADQIDVVRPQQLPSLFHTSQVPPELSTTIVGSMDPPRSVWHATGSSPDDTNGPAEVAEVATPMHCSPLSTSRVVKYITHTPPIRWTVGAHVDPRVAHDGRTGSASIASDHVLRSNDARTGTLRSAASVSMLVA